jgi:hypothetical protein
VCRGTSIAEKICLRWDPWSILRSSPDWRGPNFLGYQGLLQRIRFAVDPEVNLFYFGRI